MKDKILVFVYGTLRRHQGNYRLLLNATCIAEQCWTKGELFDTGFGYPAIKKSNYGKVYGELYEVDESELKSLDRLEGYSGPGQNNLYNRVIQTVFTDTTKHEAYVYVCGDESLLKHYIKEEDWKVYRFQKHSLPFLYFAYGSCMDDARFKKAGVDQLFKQVKGRGILEGYTLRYTRRSADGGRADIVEEGGIVEGKVYEVTADCLQYLYRREGVSAGCYRPTFIDIYINGKKFKDVLTFVVVDKEEEIAPPAHYYNEILRGGTGFLSETYMAGLKKNLQERFNLQNLVEKECKN